jgi:hypothetical protein
MRRCRQVIAVAAVIRVAGLALLRAGVAPDAGVGWLVPGQPVNGLGMGTVLAPRPAFAARTYSRRSPYIRPAPADAACTAQPASSPFTAQDVQPRSGSSRSSSAR